MNYASIDIIGIILFHVCKERGVNTTDQEAVHEAKFGR